MLNLTQIAASIDVLPCQTRRYVNTVHTGVEEAVVGWVGNPEYIYHMEQSKISACNACQVRNLGAGPPGKFFKKLTC